MFTHHMIVMSELLVHNVDESFFRSIWECLHTNISVSKVIPIADHTDLLKTLLYKTIDITCSHGTHLLNLRVRIHLAGHIPFSH